jgi:tetratricopeptide (TPR) repeat protein
LILRSLALIASSEDKEAEAVIADLNRYHPALAQETMRTWANSYIERGQAALRKDNRALAEIAFLKAVALDMSAKERIERAKVEGEAQLLNSKAWEKLLTGKPAEGLNDAEAAVARAPKVPEILDTRGQIYMALGRYDEAFTDLDKAITLGNLAASTFYTRGAIYERRGQIALAIADYTECILLPVTDKSDDDLWTVKAQDRWEVEAQDKATERIAALKQPATSYKQK